MQELNVIEVMNKLKTKLELLLREREAVYSIINFNIDKGKIETLFRSNVITAEDKDYFFEKLDLLNRNTNNVEIIKEVMSKIDWILIRSENQGY